MRKNYDCGLNNDFIVMYNVYKAWSKIFGKEEGSNEFTRNRRWFVSENEKKWCYDNDIDFKVVKEVRTVNADLKSRLRKLNLYPEGVRKDYDFLKDKESFLFFNVKKILIY